MNPAVSLGLKYLLGLGVVAGTAGGGIVYWKRVLDSKAEEEKKEKNARDVAKKSKEWKDEQAVLKNEEASWLPRECTSEDRAKSSIECNLTSGDLKKIKFKDLGGGEEAVTVTPSESENIKLKILQQGDLKKKFLFTNESNQNIVISKGGKTVTLRCGGSTEFLREKDGLAEVKLEDYGIPESCNQSNELLNLLNLEPSKYQNAKICILSEGNLSKIKFHGFPDGVDSVVTKLWTGEGEGGWGRAQNIILIINDGEYSFYNFFPDFLGHNQLAHRPITITRGSASVTLEGNMESKFTVVDGGLKKEKVTDLGFPERCEMGAEEQNKTCELSDNDIRRLKLKDTGVSPDVTYEPANGNKKMNLRIEKTSEGGYPDNKKYILSAKGDYSITIKNTIEVKDGTKAISGYHTKTLSFGKNVEKVFKNENNQLVAI